MFLILAEDNFFYIFPFQLDLYKRTLGKLFELHKFLSTLKRFRLNKNSVDLVLGLVPSVPLTC